MLTTNALSLYQGLGSVERECLNQHYLQKIRHIPQNPRQKYPKIILDRG